jgi:hypothetical protein
MEMQRTALWLLAALALAVAAAGCAARADQELTKVMPGMTQEEVRSALGPPEEEMCVRFPAYEQDYLVWQYQMVPEGMLVCPSEGAMRTVTGVATLGLSELAWRQAKRKPHWVYFLDGEMVYAGRGFDCSDPAVCQRNHNIQDGRCLD